MRIVHVVRQYHPSFGGLEDFVRNLVSAQKNAGNEVSVVTLDTNFQNGQKLQSTEVIDGVQIHRVEFVGSQRYSIAPRVSDYLGDADVVHIHAIDFFVDYLSFRKRIGLLKAKLIVSTHGGIFHTRTLYWVKQLFFRTVTPFSLSKVAVVVASSYSDQVLFEPIVHGVKVIENGVRLRKFGDVKSRADGNGFLCLGRFSENKNLVNLVRWFVAAQRSDSSLHLYIAGRADTGNVDEINAVVKQLGGESAVTVVPNPDDAKICSLIERSRFVVSASTYEGFGLTVPEMMSYGLIPVLSDIPSFRHFINGVGLGALFDFNESSFASAVSKAISNYLIAQTERCEEFAAGYSWDTVAKLFAAAYDA
ncbi:MAG: glycosyl transferase, WecB/TagA/CpsF family [Verrucomicrobiaceae bacterium]|nr:glycosyl transferase, WecB/TagA/CpsF family [Verrucomicrobiaceae bacterium]